MNVSIAEIYLNECQFAGNLPESIGNLQRLGKCCVRFYDGSITFVHFSHDSCVAVILDVSNNLLTGEVPASYANLVNLNSFDVSGNSITGEIPQGMCGLDDLSTLVADCDVTCACCSACV